MKSVAHVVPVLALVVLIGISPAADAADAPPAPSTLWSFFGIPKGLQKIRDTLTNRRGKHPNWERKPPLKKIADPANLEAENPAIKTAAKVKAEEDLAPQKIKAIKYLATVGCAGCYPGVKEALLAALDDCTEEVRNEAASAFSEAAGKPCENCNPDSCCSADVMTKLQEIAYEQDDQCCYKEPSARVREAAANALKTCRRVRPPAPEEPTPAGDKEVPVEAPEPELKEVPSQARLPRIDRWRPAAKRSSSRRFHETPEAIPRTPLIVNPISLSSLSQTGEAEVTDESVIACAGECSVGCSVGCTSRKCRHRRRPGTCIIQDGAIIQDGTVFPDDVGALAPGEALPEDLGIDDQFAAPPSGLASAPGAAYGPQSVLPNMIGDNFAGAGMSTITVQPVDQSPITIITPRPGTSVVGRLKIAENSSPIPRDRILFGYSYFENVSMFAGGVNVSRFTPGFEKTFHDGLMSFEVRTPMAVTLDSSFQADGGTDLSHGEFGNMGLTFKALLMRRPTWALAAGITAVIPTADDTEVSLSDGTLLVKIRNESTRLQPYLGLLWTPNDRFFAQGFVQWDVAANDNSVFVDQGSGLAYVDDVHDVTFQFVDVGVGYWAYRGHRRHHCVTGLAWTAELHWNASLQPTDVVTAGGFRIGQRSSNIDLVNVTLGAHVELRDKTTLTLAYVTPIGGGLDRQFDGELRILVNRRFGPQSRLTRTPF